MLHELLVALYGYPGDVFIEEEGAVKVTKGVSFLHPAEEALLNRICLLASKYKKIIEFVKIHKFVGKDDGIIHGLYARALACGIDDVLEPYRIDLWKLELEIVADPCISLTHFLHLEKYLPLFQHLLDVIEVIERKKPHGCRLLEVVYQACNCGVAMVETCMQRILRKCHVVLFRQVGNWMVIGNLSDPYGEFFIAPEPPKNANKKPAVEQYLSQGRNTFVLKPELIPSYIPGHVAEKILFVGQSVGILDPDLHVTPMHKIMDQYSEFRSKEKEYTDMLLKMIENEKFSPAEFISIVGEIRAHSAEKVWKLIVEDANLLTHLQTMKDYYLLGRGELFLAFIDSANRFLKMPSTSNTARDADTMFHIAATSTSSWRDKTAKSFHIVIHKRKGNQEIDKTNISSAKLETGWSSIDLQYEVPFPLHIIFTPKVIQKYNSVFKFLLSLRRVQVELHHCWAFQMSNKDVGRESSLVGFWQLRTHMTFLLDNLQYYLQVDVLESHFADLVHKVKSVKDFEAIQLAHDYFLDSITAQGFLMMKSVHHCLLEVLDMCSSFCSLLRKLDSSSSVSSNDMIHFTNIKSNFQRQTSLLFRILCGVHTHQTSPYLAQLLLRIDYNKYLSSCGGHLGGPQIQSG